MKAAVNLRKRKTFLAVVAAILIATFIAGAVPVNAANVCYNIDGDCSSSETFTVKTDKGWFNNQYITLRQTKGKMRFARATFTDVKYKTVNMYATYYVTVYDNSRHKYVMKNKTWKNGSMKIKLQKYSSYSVTLTPETRYTYWFVYSSDKWTKKAKWDVRKTKHCTYCQW